LVSFIRSCLPCSAISGLWWTVFLLILLIRLRLVGWREFEEREVWEAVKASLNAMFFTLIPKISGVVDPKGFCSICLVGSIYKMIAKILVNKLEMVLERIISKSQNAFIYGR
jgi:hypothetical protein